MRHEIRLADIYAKSGVDKDRQKNGENVGRIHNGQVR